MALGSLGCPEDDPAETGCTASTDCPDGEVCDVSTGECIPDVIDCDDHDGCPEGLVCDPVDAICYDDARCIFEGEPCDSGLIQPLAFVCRDDGTGTDRCFANCVSTISCPDGEVCLPVDGSENRRDCRTGGECDGLFDTSCGEGRKCVPIWEGLPFGRTGVLGKDVLTGECACIDIPAEPLAERTFCDAYVCDAGLICFRTAVQNLCAPVGCSVDETGCPEDEYCYPSSMTEMLGFGVCYADVCHPYAPETGCEEGEHITGTGCPEGEQCLIFDYDLFGYDLIGSCHPSTGEAPAGSACEENTDCAAGLCAFGRCRDLCDGAEGDAGCPAGFTCLLYFGDVSLVEQRNPGFCMESCSPFTGGSDCPDDLKCSALFTDATRGVCGLYGSSGSTGLGEPCQDFWDSDCEGDLYCLSDGTSFTCRQPCNPEVGTGEIGSCSEGEVCLADIDHDGEVAWGWCQQACVVGEPNQCGSGEECLWREVFSRPLSKDVCWPEKVQSNCTANNVSRLCGPLAFCQPPITDFSEYHACIEFCRAEMGSLNLPGHPDCNDPYAVCDDIDLNGEWGLCNSNY